MPVPGQQPDADRQGITSGHQPIAIMLDLMNPIRPGWRSLARGWQAGFDNGRKAIFLLRGGILDHDPTAQSMIQRVLRHAQSLSANHWLSKK